MHTSKENACSQRISFITQPGINLVGLFGKTGIRTVEKRQAYSANINGIKRTTGFSSPSALSKAVLIKRNMLALPLSQQRPE